MGMDIGTTTTQLVICEMVAEHLEADYLSVEPQIIARNIIYKSPIIFTPLIGENILNEEALIQFFYDCISQSGIGTKEIKTGAVIVTGESSLKENASGLLHTLADLTGEFIVATAGADLEAILAGGGSGAKEQSYEQNSIITNIDIGGGTTNIVKFISGEVVDTLALWVGGRLLRIDEDLRVIFIATCLKPMVEKVCGPVECGQMLTKQQLKTIARHMAQSIITAIQTQLPPDEEDLYISKGKGETAGALYMISGGVAEYVYEESLDLWADCVKYGDIGPLLGKMLKEKCRENHLNLLIPTHRIRATVCGSGAHSMQLSGNTIYINQPNKLPIKNLPLVKVTYQDDPIRFKIHTSRAIKYYTSDVGLYICYEGDGHYQSIKVLAQAIIEVTKEVMDYIIVITDKNIGKALGQTMAILLEHPKPIFCIDRIQSTHGDYIDLGRLVGGALPIVIKSLIF